MRERGERLRVLDEERKGGGRFLIQTESVFKVPWIHFMDAICKTKYGGEEAYNKVAWGYQARFMSLFQLKMGENEYFKTREDKSENNNPN